MEDRIIATLIKENDRTYRDRQMRVIGADGEQLGIMSFNQAIETAKSSGYDLVLVSDKSDPMVVRTMDYGKLIYEQRKREKDQKKKNQTQKVKEVKFKLRVGENDYNYKMAHAEDFFLKGYKVKITIQFAGRELAHKEIGFELFKRISGELTAFASFEGEPKLMGRTISVIFTPKSKKALEALNKSARKIDPNAVLEDQDGIDDVEEGDEA